ncbi:hypothetical protein BJ508DRAFT_357354 [Ascobolus immersus RN42]|uniref:Mitotic-spindle organizing protein 1 n=1 Tax=Ascobolus immersus RN42 TaxID=1160509 RepID=A0A3N4ISQ1_ASCIM|nr:hypothetical protein BJ508DRAFT_357354 [Ascobolus immersus RN42]
MSSSTRTGQAKAAQAAAAREVIDILYEISTILNTHLDQQTLSYCVSLIENGVNPEALATIIRELRREGEALKRSEAEG